MQIILQPVLFQPGRGFISTLEKVLSQEFNSSISTTSPIRKIPLQLFDKQRNQCKSNEVLQWLLDKHRPNRATTTTTRTTKSHVYRIYLYVDKQESAYSSPKRKQNIFLLIVIEIKQRGFVL